MREKSQEAWTYIRNSLKAFFERLKDQYRGRYPNHIRAAQQAVSAAIANAVPPRKLHVVAQEVNARLLALASVEQLAIGREHWADWVAGNRESLMDLRGKIRKDSMDEAWIEFAISVWVDNTRRSERAKDTSVHNPNDKSDKKLYPIHWLEMRISDIHALILEEGRRKFNKAPVTAAEATELNPVSAGVEFHFSWWYTSKVRPFFVKDGGRDVCVCVYHLRWDLFIETLFHYVKRLRGDLKLCKCQHTNHRNAVVGLPSCACVPTDYSGQWNAMMTSLAS